MIFAWHKDSFTVHSEAGSNSFGSTSLSDSFSKRHPHRSADRFLKTFAPPAKLSLNMISQSVVVTIYCMKKMLFGQISLSVPAKNKMFGAYRSVSPCDLCVWVVCALPASGRHRQWDVVFAEAVDSILVLLLSKSIFHQPVTSKGAGATVLHYLYWMLSDRFGSELGLDLANAPHEAGLERMVGVARQAEFGGADPCRRARHTSPDLPHLSSTAFARPNISEANNRAAMDKPSMSKHLSLSGRENNLIPHHATRHHRSAIITRFFPQYLLAGDVSMRNALCYCA